MPCDGRSFNRTRCRISPAPRRQSQIHSGVAVQCAGQPTIPLRPAALTPDAQIGVLAEASHRRQHPAFGCIDGDVQVEPIVVRAAVQRDVQRVVAIQQPCRQIDHGVTIANVSIARDGCLPRTSRHAFVDHQSIDRKLHQTDVETGEDRPIPLAWIELGQFVKRGDGNDQAVDVQPIGQPCKGPPVQFDARCIQKCAFRVGQGQAMQHGAAIDAAFYPIDTNVQARRRADAIYARDQETVARRRIQPDQRADRHQ